MFTQLDHLVFIVGKGPTTHRSIHSIVLGANCKENFVDTLTNKREACWDSWGIITPIILIVPVPIGIESFDVLRTFQRRQVVLTDSHISKRFATGIEQILAGAFVGSCPLGNGTISKPASSPVPADML